MSDIKEVLDNEIYPSLDKVEALIDLEPQDKGEYYLLTCPGCRKREAYIYKTGVYINCNRLNKCGFNQSLWDYIQTTKSLSNQETLKELARLADYTLPELDQGSLEQAERSRERANIWESAIAFFKAQLWTEGGKEALGYLKERGYTEQEIKAMELGFFSSQRGLEDYLINKGYPVNIVNSIIKDLSNISKTHKLVIPYRDPVGRVKGVIVRALEKEIERKYLYNKGLTLDIPFNLDRARGARELYVVEGFLDALIIRERGLKNVIALGGSSFSEAKIDMTIRYGTKAFILALDNDKAGEDGTARVIDIINNKTGVDVYVLPLPEGVKDPDQLIREQGIEAFKRIEAKNGYAWRASCLLGKHSIQTEKGRGDAIREAVEYGKKIKSPICTDFFIEAISGGLEVNEETLRAEIARYKEKEAIEQVEQGYRKLLRDAQRDLEEGNLIKIRERLEEGLLDLKGKGVIEAIEPYAYDMLLADIKQSPEGLKTGYKSLDRFMSIPQGAITIVASRPSHGKTTLMLNLLLNMIKKYTDKSFFFFSYEEAKRIITLKVLDILSGVKLDRFKNIEKIEETLRREGLDLSNEGIRGGLYELQGLTQSNRLFIVDEPYFVDDLADNITNLSQGYKIGAVFIDYIQKVKIKGKYQTRQIELQKVSERLLETAKELSIPIILGAQLGRDKEHRDKVRLDNLREAGDIEQDANIVLGLFNPAMEKAQEGEGILTDETIDLKVTILKNRSGQVNEEVTLSFNRPLLTIEEKEGTRDKW